MGTLPTVSVSFKKGDKGRGIVINASEFDKSVHKLRAEPPKAAPIAPPVVEAENSGAVDITEMTVPQAARIIAETNDDHVLEAFAVAEGSGRARKGVLAAIEKRREAI